MQYSSSVTQKGQATIPAPIRKKLGIKLNSKIIFEVNENQEVFIKPVADFFSMKGSVKTNKPFNIEAWERSIKEDIVKKYVKKLN